jgi:hypothetical protein
VRAQRRRLLLDKVESDYLRSQIDTGNNARAKSALQSLCKSYRLGLTVRPELRVGVVNSLVGIAFNASIDEKVRRWVLNALARVGNENDCMPAVKHMLSNFGNEPETVASSIAALYKLCERTNPKDILKGMDFDPQMITLAALQHVPAHILDLSELPLDVYKASPSLLKLALLVVGLGHSPENLLNPRHTDAEMVRVLGGHDDPIVSQYSVWAITENAALGVANLGLSLKDIDDHPANVRAWVLQLLAMEADDKEPFWEIIEYGMSDASSEARRGLAFGFKETFVDVFEPMILDWIGNEPDSEVRQHLIEHIIRQAPRSPSYHEYAIELFAGEPPDSPLRQSMEAYAVRTPLYPRFKAINAEIENDLFRGVTYVAEQNINIGNLNSGAATIGSGNATNTGPTYIQVLTQQKIEAVRAELAKLEAALHASELDPVEKQRVLFHVQEAKDAPSQGKISNVIELIGHLGTLAEAGHALAPYAVTLGALIGIS